MKENILYMKIDKTGKQMSIHGMMRMLKIVIGAKQSNENLVNQTEETLIDVIYHIKQTGVNINVEHKIIEDFLNTNPIPIENNNDQLSNKEAKSIYNNIDRHLLEDFDYNIVD